MTIKTKETKRKVLLVGNIILCSAAIEFIMLSLITSRGTADEIGKFLFGLTFIQLFSSMLTLGLPPLLVRLSQTLNGKNWTPEIGKLFTIVAAVTTLFSLFFVQYSSDLTSWLNRDYLTKVMLLLVSCTSLTTFLFLWCGLLQGKNRPILASSLQFFAIPIVMGTLLLSQSKSSLEHTKLLELYLMSCASVTALSFTVWLLSGTSPNSNSKTEDANHKSWKTFALNALMQQWLMWGGLLLASPFISDSDFALLSLAQKLSVTLAIPLFSMNYVIAPKLAAAYLDQASGELRQLVALSIRILRAWLPPYFFAICVIGAIALYYLGGQYSSAIPYFFVFLLGQLFNVWSGSVGVILMMTHNEKSFSWVLIYSCILSAFVTLTLSWQFGAYGAALGCTFSLFIQNGLAMRAIRKKLGYQLLQRDFA